MRRGKTTTRKTLTKRNAQGTPIFEVLRLPDDKWGHAKMQRERVQRLIWEAGAWSTWAMHLSLHGHSRVTDPAEGKRATAVARALSALAAAYVFDDASLKRKGREAAKELRTPRMVDLRDLEWGEGGWLHCFSDPFVDGGKGGNRRAALEENGSPLHRASRADVPRTTLPTSSSSRPRSPNVRSGDEKPGTTQRRHSRGADSREPDAIAGGDARRTRCRRRPHRSPRRSCAALRAFRRSDAPTHQGRWHRAHRALHRNARSHAV